MSTIISYPDALSFSQNIRTFSITSSAQVIFELYRDEVLILSEKYQPTIDNEVSVSVKSVIEGLLDVSIPSGGTVLNEQLTGFGNFRAVIDGTEILFRVVKGGVSELQELPAVWLAAHFLTWQPVDKAVLQTQPEWLGLYTVSAGSVRLKAYYADETSYEGTFAETEAAILYTIRTNWGAVSAWLTAEGHSGEAVAWDVWYEVVQNAVSVRVTPVQRYRLRYCEDQEHVYVWVNTLGGIDSVSFSGALEQDYKLVHKTALHEGDNISEYDVEKPREFRQSTGYLDRYEAEWIADFFYSRKKYSVRFDGAFKRIAVTSSKIADTSQQDEVEYEFTYRLGEDLQLLNLERVNVNLPAPEGLVGFFLTELLSGLTTALYSDNLYLAVQSPFSRLWQVLTLAQLWGGALPGLVDGTTIMVVNGKLRALGAAATDTATLETIKKYIDSLLWYNEISDYRTLLISGAVIWETGLTYQSTDIVYKLSGIQYTAMAKQLTLAAADPAFGRLDTFYVDGFANLGVITGIPSANPVAPVLNGSQLGIMTVFVAAGATVPSDIANEIIYDENTEWETSETHDEDITVDFASADAPVSGGKRIKIAVAVPDTAVALPLHYIGEKYRGGRIFYLDDTGTKGLIAAEYDTANNVFWSPLSGYSVYSTGATGAGIGTGAANSLLMLASSAAKDFAVRFCDELVVDGYNDWYLPSEKELYAMWFRRYEIGNFGTRTYWSSTETEWKRARCITFDNGSALTRDKNNRYCVRAIRAFDDSTIENNLPVATCTVSNTVLTFIKPGGAVAVNSGILALHVKSSEPWLPNSFLTIESYQGSIRTGGVMLSPSATMLGYNHADDAWQLVAIQLAKFYPTGETVNKFKISLSGSWPNHIDLGFDAIRFQYNNVIPPEDALLTPGTFGSATKSLQLTVSPGGKITAVKELDIERPGGNGPDNGLADIAFEFRDLTPGTIQEYTLDISAIFKYRIIGIALETDAGTYSGVYVRINGNAVSGMSDFGINSLLTTTMATGANAVAEGNRTKLCLPATYTGLPTTIRGKLIIQKTNAALSHSPACDSETVHLAQDQNFEYVVGIAEPIFIQVYGINSQPLGFERSCSMGVWSINVIGTDAQEVKINYQKSYNGVAPALAYISEKIDLLQDTTYNFIAGLFEPVFVQIFGANGQELGFERTVTDGLWTIRIFGTDAQSARISLLTSQVLYSSGLTYIKSSLNLLQDVDYPFFIGVTEPKFIQVFGENGQTLGFERVFADAMWRITIFGSDAQAANLFIQL